MTYRRFVVPVALLSLAVGSVLVTGCADESRAGQKLTLSQLSPQEFVTQAASGGLFEVESSRLALGKNLPQADKDFAQTMVSDHTKANDELKSLAQQKQLNVPPQMLPKHQVLFDALRPLDGAELAMKYHDQQMAAHKEAVELFAKASEKLEDPELKAFAARTLPTLRRHLEMCKGFH